MTQRRWLVVHRIVLQVVLPVLRRLPYRWSVFLLGIMGRLDLIVVPHQTRLYEHAVADGARRLGCWWDVRSVSRALARQTYRWRTRDILLGDRAEPDIEHLFQVSGREHLDAALARGRGVILLANHFGSHVAIVHWLFRRGYAVRWFGEKPRNVSDYLLQQFQTDGPLGQEGLFVGRRTGLAHLASVVLQATRALNAGLILVMACDIRWRDAKSASAHFLGRTETFSTTWVNLAARTGAAVVPSFCRMQEDGVFHLEFGEPFDIPRTVLREGQTGDWVQQAVTRLEEQIRRYPEQSNDYFFWQPDQSHAA